MSDFTLGERYGSEDMYREFPDLNPGDRVAYEKDGVVYTDYVDAVRSDPAKRAQVLITDMLKTIERLGEPWAPLTRRQRIWRRIRAVLGKK